MKHLKEWGMLLGISLTTIIAGIGIAILILKLGGKL
jgi:hypothetical protein